MRPTVVQGPGNNLIYAVKGDINRTIFGGGPTPTARLLDSGRGGCLSNQAEQLAQQLALKSDSDREKIKSQLAETLE